MNRFISNTLLASAAVGLAMTFAAAGTASAGPLFIIDDFNTGTAQAVTDTAVDGVPVTAATVIDGTNIVMNGGPTNPPSNLSTTGWSRDISADLTAGDQLSTQVCLSCQAGHYVSGAGGARGVSSYIYNGPSVDLKLDTLEFDYAADRDGGIVTFTFGRDQTFVTVSSGSLPNTNGSSSVANLTPVQLDLPDSDPDWIFVFDDVTFVRIDIDGRNVDDLDLTIDNVTLVPLPASAALLGLGLVALGLVRRRIA